MCVVAQKETNQGEKRTHLNGVRLGKNSIRPALQSHFSKKPQQLNVASIYVTSATVGLVLPVAIVTIQD